jgi:hypothetical protein
MAVGKSLMGQLLKMLSFKDFVGASRQRQRDGDAERLRGLKVQEQFDLGGLLHGRSAGFAPFRIRPA